MLGIEPTSFRVISANPDAVDPETLEAPYTSGGSSSPSGALPPIARALVQNPPSYRVIGSNDISTGKGVAIPLAPHDNVRALVVPH
jgi:hypothetical protein